MNVKSTIIALIIAGGLIASVVFFSGGAGSSSDTAPVQNVREENGKQIVELTAKGGFGPRKSVAIAGKPTILRINTKGTFDCSASVRIPSKNVFQVLPQTGTTDIDLGTSTAGVLRGSCGMGMYPFEIDFQAQ